MEKDIQINKNKIVNSFLWKFMERILVQGMNLAIQIILARLLLPEDFGSLAILSAITNYAAIFVQSGLSTAVIQKENLDDLDISTLLISSLGIAAVFYVALFVFSPNIASYYHDEKLSAALRILALVLFLNAINSVQTALLTRKMEFKMLFFKNLVAIAVSGLVGIIMAYCGFGIWALVAHHLVQTLAAVVIMAIGQRTKVNWSFSWKRAIDIYRFSGKILLSNLVSGMQDTVRTMVIGGRYSSSDLAYYDKANTYSYYVVQSANGAIGSVLLPVFSRKQTQIEALKQMARKSVQLSTFVMFPVLLGFAAVSNSFVTFFLTEKWLPSVPFLILFCVLRLPGCIMAIDTQVYYALGKSGINLAYETILCSVKVIALFISMHHSVLAIAVSATVVELLGAALIFVIGAKVYRYSLWERMSDLIKPLVNSVVMAAVVWSVQLLNLSTLLTLAVQVFAGVCVYLILAIVTKDRNLMLLKKMLIKKN